MPDHEFKKTARHALEEAPPKSLLSGLQKSFGDALWSSYPPSEQWVVATTDDYQFTVWANGLAQKRAHIAAPGGGLGVWVDFWFPPNKSEELDRILVNAANTTPKPKLKIGYYFDDSGNRIIAWIQTP